MLPSLKLIINENLHKYIEQCMPNEYISQHRGTGFNDLAHLSASHNTSWSVEKPTVMYVHILISNAHWHFKSKHEQYMYLHCPTLRNATCFCLGKVGAFCNPLHTDKCMK